LARIFVDAKDKVLGRLASFVAKQALLGKEVYVVNVEKCVISGNKRYLVEFYVQRRQRGRSPRWGPKYPKRPDLIFRRAVRGMLPYKKEKGRKALRKVKVFIGVPDEFKKVNFVELKEFDASKFKIPKYIYLEDLCKELGWKP